MSVPTVPSVGHPPRASQNRSIGRARAATFGTRIVFTGRSFGLIGVGRGLTSAARGRELARQRQRLRSTFFADDSAPAGCAKSVILSRRSRNQTGQFRHAYLSAVRAILDDPPITSAQVFPAHCGCREKEPYGFSHFGMVIIPPRVFDRHQILLTTCHDSVHKGLNVGSCRAGRGRSSVSPACRRDNRQP